MGQKIALFLVLALGFTASFNCQASSGGFPVQTPVKNKAQAVASSPQVPAKETAITTQAKPQKPQASKVDKEKLKELQRRKMLIEKKRAILNDTKWDIVLIPMSAEGKELEDEVIFSEGKVSLTSLQDKGFLPTNYTLNIEDDGRLIWETMQTGENETVFLRGEIAANFEKMSGVISFQKPLGNQDYSFSSTARTKLIEGIEEE